MATPYQTVYDAFLSKIKEDEWINMSDTIVLEDWRSILESAIPYFKFPRTSLERDDDGFINTLKSNEIQVLAMYMKEQWLGRNIASWDKIKTFYTESEFSQANFLDKLISLQKETETRADKLQHIYYRSIDGKPYPYGRLAEQ